jgi:hypothetical protein
MPDARLTPSTPLPMSAPSHRDAGLASERPPAAPALDEAGSPMRKARVRTPKHKKSRADAPEAFTDPGF